MEAGFSYGPASQSTPSITAPERVDSRSLDPFFSCCRLKFSMAEMSTIKRYLNKLGDRLATVTMSNQDALLACSPSGEQEEGRATWLRMRCLGGTHGNAIGHWQGRKEGDGGQARLASQEWNVGSLSTLCECAPAIWRATCVKSCVDRDSRNMIA